MRTAFAAGVAALLVGGGSAAEPEKVNAGMFVQTAVENGLAEGGIPVELAAELAKRDDDFVGKCEICEPTRRALKAHAKREKVTAATDPLPADLVKALRSDDAGTRQPALTDLVERCVAREATRQKLTGEQKDALKADLERMRKVASANLGKRKGCALCDGACKLK
jgi:hypothetical protein